MYGGLIKRWTPLADVLLDIASNESEELPVRLCAASILVSWNDPRVQPILEKLSANASYLHRTRIRLLQLALNGDPAARHWV